VGGVQLQTSSDAGVADCSQTPPAPHELLVAVHCSQAPESTLVDVVSHTGVPPVHAPPVSPQEHLRQFVRFVPEQTARSGPVLVHLFCLLLQTSCTLHVRPLTVIVSPAPFVSQMSAISPQLLLLSPHAAGAA
jgi:hypothetical protein